MPSHNMLVFGAKIMNRLLLRKWFASQMLIFDAGGWQIRQNWVVVATPSVVAQPFHSVAMDSGRLVALVVFNSIYIYMCHLCFETSLHTCRIHPQLKTPCF